MAQNPVDMTISELATKCMTTLDELINKVPSSTEDGSHVLADDFRGRFRVWAANNGALQLPSSPNSLDSLIKTAGQMKLSIVSGLVRINESGTTALRIVTGDLPNRQRYTTRNGHSEIEKDELKELLKNISSAVDNLFELSIILRRYRPRGRTPHVAFEPSTSSQDISNVGDRYPKARNKSWLLQRLGNAVSLRRQNIQYRQIHRLGLPEGKGKEIENAATSKATTFLGAADLLNPMRALSIHTSATSSESSFGTTEDGQSLRVPPLTEMVLDGVALRYGEKFECPYCRTICMVETRDEWKKHVFSDLQPYVCTYQDCEQPLRLFENRNAWIRHERDVHCREWSCILCDRSASFRNRGKLEEHISVNHQGKVTASQLPVIIEACGRPRANDAISCPLCLEAMSEPASPNSHEEYANHLARHLQQIALASIPIYIEGLETKNKPDLDEPNDDETILRGAEHIRVPEFNCDGCQLKWAAKPPAPDHCPRCHSDKINLGKLGHTKQTETEEQISYFEAPDQHRTSTPSNLRQNNMGISQFQTAHNVPSEKVELSTKRVAEEKAPESSQQTYQLPEGSVLSQLSEGLFKASWSTRGRKGSVRSSPLVTYTWIWYCSNCAAGPLNETTDQACPNCQHWRCEYCSTSQVAMPANRSK